MKSPAPEWIQSGRRVGMIKAGLPPGLFDDRHPGGQERFVRAYQAAQLVYGCLRRDAPGDQQVDDLGDWLLVLLIGRYGLGQVRQSFPHTC